MIVGVAHTSFVVSDLDQSLAFYRDALNCSLDWRVDRDTLPALRTQVGFAEAVVSVAQMWCPGGGHRLELMQYHEPRGVAQTSPRNTLGASHLCFLVDDMPAAVSNLRDSGVTFVSEPQRFDDDGGISAVYLLDPDGITVELTTATDLAPTSSRAEERS